jgi:hypothetical protein
VQRQLGAPVGAGWQEGVPAERRLEQLAADPSEQPWLVGLEWVFERPLPVDP